MNTTDKTCPPLSDSTTKSSSLAVALYSVWASFNVPCFLMFLQRELDLTRLYCRFIYFCITTGITVRGTAAPCAQGHPAKDINDKNLLSKFWFFSGDKRTSYIGNRIRPASLESYHCGRKSLLLFFSGQYRTGRTQVFTPIDLEAYSDLKMP